MAINPSRLERVEDRSITGNRGARTEGLRAPTVRTEDLHYNETYGTSLTDAQSQAVDKQQNEFRNTIATANQELSTARTDTESKYQKALSLLNSEQQKLEGLGSRYNTLPDFETWYTKTAPEVGVGAQTYIGGGIGGQEGYWEGDSFVTTTPAEMYTTSSGYWDYGPTNEGNPTWVDTGEAEREAQKKEYRILYNNNFKASNPDYNEWLTSQYLPNNTVPFYVRNNGETYATYRMLPADAAKFSSQIGAEDKKGSPYISAPTGDGGYYIEVRGYGAEITEPLQEYQFQMESALIDAYSGKMRSDLPKSAAYIQEQRGYLDKDYSNATALLSQRQREIEAANNQNTEGLNLVRMKYQEKLGRIKDTIGSLVYG